MPAIRSPRGVGAGHHVGEVLAIDERRRRGRTLAEEGRTGPTRENTGRPLGGADDRAGAVEARPRGRLLLDPRRDLHVDPYVGAGVGHVQRGVCPGDFQAERGDVRGDPVQAVGSSTAGAATCYEFLRTVNELSARKAMPQPGGAGDDQAANHAPAARRQPSEGSYQGRK